MPLRFRRTIRLFPGVRLNVSKSGVSNSIGTRGAWFTFGKRGTRTTVGLPGTGISYTSTSSARQHEHEQPTASPPSIAGWFVLVAIVVTVVIVGIVQSLR